MRVRLSSGVMLELRKVARRPTEIAASTWSFISEISGLTTRTTPFNNRAGIW